jgi:hypothetical protein
MTETGMPLFHVYDFSIIDPRNSKALVPVWALARDDVIEALRTSCCVFRDHMAGELAGSGHLMPVTFITVAPQGSAYVRTYHAPPMGVNASPADVSGTGGLEGL